nr:RNA polymerase sigma-70 factor [uncultured Allomuricauda sp.]
MKKDSNQSDEELVARIRKEDKKAFGILFDRYWERLLLQARIKLNSEFEAEEVVQDVFVGLWKRRHKLELRYTFHSYIASCVKYEIFARYAKREKNKRFVHDENEILQLVDTNTEDWLDYESVRSMIEKAVEELPERCRLVFKMSREEGLSHKEISEELNIGTKTVEAHITKAIRLVGRSIGYSNMVGFLFLEYLKSRN